MTKLYKEHKIQIIIGLCFLFVVALVAMIWVPIIQSLKIVFGSALILFVPGFFLSLIFFPNEKLGADSKLQSSVERSILSLFFSLASITITLVILHEFNLALKPIHIISVVVILSLVFAFSLFLVEKFSRKNQNK